MLSIVKKIKSLVPIAYKYLFVLLGKFIIKNPKMVIFESFLGKQISDNPKAIYDYLAENYPNYVLIWSVDNRFVQEVDKNIRTVKRFSIKWLFYMNRAKYWVSNSRMPLWIPKSNRTVYLQTWHGTPLKKLAADMNEVHMPGTNTEKYKRNFLKESQKWDYLISPNAYSTEIFKRAFEFDREILETGYPRNDYLINSNTPLRIHEIKKRMGLPLNKKIILYAPTWRDNQYHKKGEYKFDYEMDFEKMKDRLGDQYILLLRLHYLVRENISIEGAEGFVYDCSLHEDIRELYLVSDLLVTDYSSVFFDYANLKKPIIFYVHDLEEYRDKLRGFYFDLELDAPGPLVKTTEELVNEITSTDTDGHKVRASEESFYMKYCYLEDGNASRRVVEHIFKKE
ncbi:CDP-glycerol--glycerophosphate glycerophosphotransferase [Oceanobacillus iheyensis]|nr:CDP-glycerol--glycerophosphate glycerophosphotransferase [Oceanobacillus iheyensis]